MKDKFRFLEREKYELLLELREELDRYIPIRKALIDEENCKREKTKKELEEYFLQKYNFDLSKKTLDNFIEIIISKMKNRILSQKYIIEILRGNLKQSVSSFYYEDVFELYIEINNKDFYVDYSLFEDEYIKGKDEVYLKILDLLRLEKGWDDSFLNQLISIPKEQKLREIFYSIEDCLENSFYFKIYLDELEEFLETEEIIF